MANPSVATGTGLRLEEEGHPLVAVIQIAFLFLLRLEGLRLGGLLCAYARVEEKAVRRRRNRIRVPSQAGGAIHVGHEESRWEGGEVGEKGRPAAARDCG